MFGFGVCTGPGYTQVPGIQDSNELDLPSTCLKIRVAPSLREVPFFAAEETLAEATS